MSKVDVSYGILHYNPGCVDAATAAFEKTVDSLATNSRLPKEVFIIDQGNPFREAKIGYDLARQYGFNFIALKQNVGISRGINLLANMARGQYISLVTSDVEFTPNLDIDLVNVLEKNQDIWQICPVSEQSDIIYQRRDYQSSGITRTIAQELTIQFWPRSTFEKIGYFDERWKACYENLDYALRIFIAGGFAAISHDTFCPHDFHMSMRSGARDHAYDGYINMGGSFDQSPLAYMWRCKWPRLEYLLDIYNALSVEDKRYDLLKHYEHNIYLPYIQDVDY